MWLREHGRQQLAYGGLAADLEQRSQGRAGAIERDRSARIRGGKLLVHQHARERAEPGPRERGRQLETEQADRRVAVVDVRMHGARGFGGTQCRRELGLREIARRTHQQPELFTVLKVEHLAPLIPYHHSAPMEIEYQPALRIAQAPVRANLEPFADIHSGRTAYAVRADRIQQKAADRTRHPCSAIGHVAERGRPKERLLRRVDGAEQRDDALSAPQSDLAGLRGDQGPLARAFRGLLRALER